MKIIVKIKDKGVEMAWVAVDDTTAVLIPYGKDDAKTFEDAKVKNDRRDRLIVVRAEIKRIKGKYNIR